MATARPTKPGARRTAVRPGPRPLPLHLAMPTMLYTACSSALPGWRTVWPTLNGAGQAAGQTALERLTALLAETLQPQSRERPGPANDPAEPDPVRLAEAVDREYRRRLDEMLTGLERYRRHPHRRRLHDPPAVWREGSTALRRYEPPAGASAGPGRPVLVVPSLVNRAYILDLSEDCSLMRWLAERGVRPYLVDWGAPEEAEFGFGLADYIARLDRAFEFVCAEAGGRAPVIGYCMGGLLAMALAVRRPERTERLALLAMPWDFHAGRADHGAAMQAALMNLEPVMQTLGYLPVDCLQAMFASLDPFLAFAKFRRFAAMPEGTKAAERFVAVEDWLNDGVPLAAPVARECLRDWYVANAPHALAWRVENRIVDPADYPGEALVVVPQRDRIVPPDSARAVIDRLKDVRVIHPNAGHIGMIAGHREGSEMWERLAGFLGRS